MSPFKKIQSHLNPRDLLCLAQYITKHFSQSESEKFIFTELRLNTRIGTLAGIHVNVININLRTKILRIGNLVLTSDANYWFYVSL